MSNLFAMFSTATRALQANTFMISTASHNLANAETEGYSRQRVELMTASAQTIRGVGQIGKGVDVNTVRRLRDEYLDAKIRTETSTLGKYEKAQEGLDHIETVFNEPKDSNLGNIMSQMWTSWSDLAANPEGTTQRMLVAQRTDEMAKQMNHMYEQMESLADNTVDELEGMAYNANALLDKIQATTKEIHKLRMQHVEPNDLLDKRDLYLEQLSEIVNIKVQEDNMGRVRITTADTGHELLNYTEDEPPDFKMSVVSEVKYDETTTPTTCTLTIANGGDTSKMSTVVMPNNGQTYKAGDLLMVENPLPNDGLIQSSGDFEASPYRPETGTVAGAQMAIKKSEEYLADLDALAYTIASAINTVHTMDDTDIPFFTAINANENPSSYPQLAPEATTMKGAAKNLQVNPTIISDSSHINAGKTPGAAVGNNERAVQISKLQDLMFNTSDIEGLHDQLDTYDADTMTIQADTTGATTQGFYRGLTGKIGVDSQSSQNMITNQESLLDQLEMKRQSVSGVSIDEEVSDLIRFMTAYQANARVVNTITEMLDTLIGLKQ